MLSHDDIIERELMIHDWIKNNIDGLQQRAVVTIPVVVHVVWNKNEENIPDAQIYSQIEVLNKDFRAANTEIPGIPTVFKNLVADVEFEFCLATKAPNGSPTNGITRTFTNNSVGIGGTVNIHYTSMGGRNAWDPLKYLNIWVAKFAGGVGVAASFPGTGPIAEDGVQIDYRHFGNINTEPPYHLGRTCTHEIGHYFNLEHVWGPSITSCCNDDDFVADTPNACETYLGQCPTHPVVSCTQPDMFMNYMFYTDDACMGMFTLGQKARMWAALNAFRPGLLTSDACGTVNTHDSAAISRLVVFRNPFSEKLQFEIQSSTPENWLVLLTDMFGRKFMEIYVASNGLQEMPVEDLPSGLYLLSCENGRERLIEKVLLVK